MDCAKSESRVQHLSRNFDGTICNVLYYLHKIVPNLQMEGSWTEDGVEIRMEKRRGIPRGGRSEVGAQSKIVLAEYGRMGQEC